MRTAKRIALRRVLIAWSHTTFTLLTMMGMVGFLAALTAFLGEWQAVVGFLESGAAVTCVAIFLQEMIVVLRLKGSRASRKEYPRFHEAIDHLMKGRRLMTRPRLWIVKMPKELPNAVAFGPGIFGWHSIAISDSLYKLMDDDELRAVVAHEFAHVRCRDTGILTILSFVLNGAQTFGNALKGLGGISTAIGWMILCLGKYVLPIGTAALQQEREYAADALSAVYCGSPQPLIRALKKLEAEADKHRKEDSDSADILSDLWISHPHMADRIAALEELVDGNTHESRGDEERI